MRYYQGLFGVSIPRESSAKDNFQTNYGGTVYAAGAAGTITGRGAGIYDPKWFGGSIVIDDIHKPHEATSETIRTHSVDWYFNTLQSRVNSRKTPIIFIGQRVHEDDLCAHLLKGEDGEQWDRIILPALDRNNHALHPKMHDTDELLNLQAHRPYEFAAQYQQDPQPASGGIFKTEWFVLKDEEPDNIQMTFITCDTAETEKTYNDATVFSFWGLYRISDVGQETDVYGLHWIDCVELRVEPKDLETEFLRFYQDCLHYALKPSFAAIEKKSTGTTLISILKERQGLRVHEIERTRQSGDKTSRFLASQPYVARRCISLPRHGKHTKLCLEHCRKITANNTHRFDDIADTLADAIQLGLIDGFAKSFSGTPETQHRVPANWPRTTQARLRAWE